MNHSASVSLTFHFDAYSHTKDSEEFEQMVKDAASFLAEKLSGASEDFHDVQVENGDFITFELIGATSNDPNLNE